MNEQVPGPNPSREQSPARQPTEEELCHERLGDEFAQSLSNYDTQRRVETLVDEFLAPLGLRGVSVLDVGCGLGFFSERLLHHGAEVVACDIGAGLVARTGERLGCQAVVADALNLTGQFGRGSFDMVVSSECIEHTPDPDRAVSQMLEVVKPGGYVALSTPNLVWSPVVKSATLLRLRPFDGFENFSSWRGLRRLVAKQDATIVTEQGLHLFPFQLRLNGLSRICDRLQFLRAVMINICMLIRASA